MVTSCFRPEVEMPFRACTVKICNITFIRYYRNSSVIVDLLCGRYHVPQNVFLVSEHMLILVLITFICL